MGWLAAELRYVVQSSVERNVRPYPGLQVWNSRRSGLASNELVTQSVRLHGDRQHRFAKRLGPIEFT